MSAYLVPRQELRQSRGLVLSHQMRQAIGMLRMTRAELEQLIDSEMESNPLLVREEAADSGLAEVDGSDGDMSWSMSEQPMLALAEIDIEARDIHDAAPGELAAGEAVADADGSAQGRRLAMGLGDVDAGSDLDRRDTITLQDHLRAQLAPLGLSPGERGIAFALIDGLDGAGYLTIPPAEFAMQLGCDEARIEAVLHSLRALEPVGVFARDLAECLALQLADVGRWDTPMARLVERLDLVAARDIAALAQRTGLGLEAVRERIGWLRALTPRPGAAFGGAPAQVATADVTVRSDGVGGWRVELNTEGLASLHIDAALFARVAKAGAKQADRAFAADCQARAEWLVQGLQQRSQTVLKVASDIVQRQWEFFTYGVERLRPLTLRQVADAIGVHESTVSRAVAGKYIATERGLFELRFFFSAAVGGKAGEPADSAQAVRQRLRRLIASEPAEAYSDEALAELLQKEGVSVARRTVTKYREMLGIPCAAERRLRQAA